jgi:DNA invertase Pin-like site-specific DNA recombinase
MLKTVDHHRQFPPWKSMTICGYVSSLDHPLTAQRAELHQAGAVKVYRERISSAAARHSQLEKMLHMIGPGDGVLLTWPDRLSRSTRDLLNILDEICKAGTQFKSLHETWPDSTTAVIRLMITIIGGIAEFERELIHARTGDGIRCGQAARVHVGRPPRLTKRQQREDLAQLDRCEEIPTEIARSYLVSHMTISRIKAQHAAA